MKKTWVDELIEQYTSGVRDLERYRKSLDRADLYDAEEAKTVSGMLSDMRYALDWMRRGRRPGSRRGADRRDIYRRRELLAGGELTEDEKRRLIDCVAVMTERELTCWLLHMAHGLTISEISDRLKVSRRSVQTFLERARSKIQQRLS